MISFLKQLLGIKSRKPLPTDLHEFMTRCSPEEKKAVYLEAAKRAFAEQRRVLDVVDHATPRR